VPPQRRRLARGTWREGLRNQRCYSKYGQLAVKRAQCPFRYVIDDKLLALQAPARGREKGKNKNIYTQSRQVIENKWINDTMTEKERTFWFKFRTFWFNVVTFWHGLTDFFGHLGRFQGVTRTIFQDV
jgi:hypothetical protein